MPDASRSAPDHAEEFGLAEDEVLDALDLDFVARVLAVDDGVALADAHLGELAVVEALARAGGDDLALDGALLARLGQIDAAGGFGFGLIGLDEDTVFEGFDCHFIIPLKSLRMQVTILISLCLGDFPTTSFVAAPN